MIAKKIPLVGGPLNSFPMSAEPVVTTVRIPPTLRVYTSGQITVDAEGQTLQALLDSLLARFPGLDGTLCVDGELASFIKLYVDGRDIRELDGLATELSGHSQVLILPALAGG